MVEQKIVIDVLEDGTLRIETGDMGKGVVHTQADAALGEIARLMGGATEKQKLPQRHRHHHETVKRRQ